MTTPDLSHTPLAQAVELEAAVMCSLMKEPELVAGVALLLEPGDLQSPLWKKVYTAILAINAVGCEPDFVNVFDYMGDVEFEVLARAESITMTGENVVKSSVPLIKKYSRLRAAQKIMIESVQSLGSRPGIDLGELWNQLGGDFLKLLQEDTAVVGAQDQATDSLKRLENHDAGHFIKLGLRPLDETTGGAELGSYWLIAGRPSMGKSALAANFFLYMGRTGVEACTVILEGTRHDLMVRMISIYTGIELERIRLSKLTPPEVSRVTHAAGIIGAMPLHFIQERRWAKIRPQIQSLKLRRPLLAVVFIDYLSLVEASRNFREREREVAFISADIKGLGLELNIANIVLQQLNRMVESRSDHKPKLSDLRESGSIEQDADVVLFPYRASYYQESSNNSTDAEICIAKNRHGRTGTVEAKFEDSCVRFSERDR